MRYEKAVIIKDNTECMIRSATAADAAGVYDCFCRTHAETDYLLTYPDENHFTVEGEQQFLTEKEASDKEVELCAVIEGEIVGVAGFERVGSCDKLKHRAEFGISIRKAYWGRGIGRALTESCIECARNAGYAQLELNVISDNDRAVELYKSAGFTEFGRNPRGFRSRSSGWQELILMRMELDPEGEYHSI
mgnify:CR=1 FL=1